MAKTAALERIKNNSGNAGQAHMAVVAASPAQRRKDSEHAETNRRVHKEK